MSISYMAACSPGVNGIHHVKPYDYCLKFLLVGDSDVGKNEILNLLEGEQFDSNPLYPCKLDYYSIFKLCCSINTSSGLSPKTTVILLEGKKVKLQLW